MLLVSQKPDPVPWWSRKRCPYREGPEKDEDEASATAQQSCPFPTLPFHSNSTIPWGTECRNLAGYLKWGIHNGERRHSQGQTLNFGGELSLPTETRLLKFSNITSLYKFIWPESRHSHSSWEKFIDTSLNITDPWNNKRAFTMEREKKKMIVDEVVEGSTEKDRDY